jgi:uncharacterized OB-fold protein
VTVTVPEPSEVSAPFWEATRQKQLVIQYCAVCREWVWYPRAFCPACLSPNLAWRAVSGKGSVYAISVHRRAISPEFKDRTPYAVALVELTEGVRMLSGLLGPGATEAEVGAEVVLAWERIEDGRHLPYFALS